MFNFLSKLFSKKSASGHEVHTPRKYNMISFYIDEWNRYNIFTSIEITNPSATEEFGKLLYLLNSGKYEKNILDYMVSMGKEKPMLTKSVQESLVSWASCIQKNMENKDETPYVRPTQVFK